MSGTRPTNSVDGDMSISEFSLKRTSAPELISLDRRLERLGREVLPLYPFLLTIPTDVPFRPGGRFVNNWAVGNDGPFTPDEQQLQYMTFLTHQDGDSLLVAVGDWSDGAGSIMSDQRSGHQSAASTPSNVSLKKKISLNDYRKRRKSGTSVSPINQEPSIETPVSHPLGNNQSGTKHHTPTEDAGKRISRVPHIKSSARPGNDKVGRKRPPESDHEQLTSREGKHAGVVSPKKARLSPEKVSHTKTEISRSNGLPDLLSPTLPPTSNSPRLPRLLSPTLPPDLEKELSRLDEGCSTSSAFKGLRPYDSAALGGDSQKPRSYEHGRLQSYSASGLSSNDRSSDPSADKSVSTPLSSKDLDFCDSPNIALHGQRKEQTPQLTDVKRFGTAKPQLVIKLKYGRSNRKRVEALLKFSGKRKAASSNSPVHQRTDHENHHLIKAPHNQPKAPLHGHTVHKSHRVEGKNKNVVGSEATISLRERPKESRTQFSEKSRLPTSSISGSAPPHTEGLKHSKVTSVKGIKDSTHRTEAIHSDVLLGDQLTLTKSTPAQPNSPGPQSRFHERRAWKDEYQRLGNLGRELKHAAERHTAKDAATAADEKVAAVTAIEAIICFILAFVADDQSKSLARQVGDSSTWLSILAYWRVVRKNSIPYPRLHSLCLILGAVSYDAIHSLDLERLAITPIPGDHAPVPTPGSDGLTVTSDENRKAWNAFLELKNRLPECYKESQRLWLEGLQGLSEDILAREFPETWSKRSKRYSDLAKQRPKIGDYAGEFLVPPGRTTTPVESVRFGHSILREWCIKEDVAWSSRLDL
ncbi:uncharacterized protein ACLA_026930 [Aspergillus clavatus NRRL 1]|uniref:Ell binding protein Ebp1 C-terminal domain-containing protein n=1 Tax=Aspergillus clavatus (strain ATCC 1007 / CBS 513.65 / DSM 816 / NCTC 3887 / NRRL 1 / QM 1276 / 107) TaxID=344612 RepID=A1CQQ0_ASPCL|nr:uncharacterized protein ACLA_026930 [Aspergillus clavatus NRRL 1]EAW07971.1 conserved hypothetical protein [Aspergillus clavatus NRRL 1]